jgi:putative FmdB family regulatory protein
MPIYEYHCNKCDDIFEELIRMSDPNPPCPKCGEKNVEKLISRSSFHLKGGGWYVTDYGGQGKEPSTAQKENNDEAPSKKNEKKSDSSTGNEKTTSKKSTKSES